MTDIYFSRFWKVEVWNQGASMVKPWWQTADLLYPHMAGGKERKQMLSYYKGTQSPSWGLHLHDLTESQLLPKGPSS